MRLPVILTILAMLALLSGVQALAETIDTSLSVSQDGDTVQVAGAGFGPA